MSHYTLVETDSKDRPVPVIAENVGPYASLADALAAWSGFEEATDEQVDRYERYWNDYYEREDRTTT